MSEIEVACRCGRRFAAQPYLAGKSVSCPSCGSPIAVPAPVRSSASTGLIVAACQCGQRFNVQPRLAGTQVRCPVCRHIISVPGTTDEPRDLESYPLQSPEMDDPFRDDLSTKGAATAAQTPLPPAPIRRPAARRSPKPARKKRKGPMPESARTVCLALATGGFLWMIFAGMGIYLMVTDGLDAVGRGITIYLACLAIGGYVSSVLVWQRVPFAVVPAVFVSMFYLIFFPLGTIVAIIVFSKLFAEDTRRYLARR